MHLTFEHLDARSAHLERCCPLDSTQHSAGFAFPPVNTLGARDMLPSELTNQVLLCLNPSTITAFRRVNQCARSYFDSLYKYNDTITHAPNVLRVTLASNSADWITLRSLNSARTSTHKCSTCSDFSSFISLFACTRTFYLCASRKTALHPLKPCEARVRYALDEPSSQALHRGKIIPGQYTPNLSDPARTALKVNGTKLLIEARQSRQASSFTGQFGKCTRWWPTANGSSASNSTRWI